MNQEDPTKTTVYVDVEDDITTIIEKVEDATGTIVALVLPKRSSVLQSTVNMRLLKQSTEAANKKAVLITSETALLPLAGAIGLPVAKNLQSAAEVPSAPKKPGEEELQKDTGQPYATAIKPIGKPIAQPESGITKKLDPAVSVGALADAQERKEPETVELDDESDDKPASGTKQTFASVAAGAAAKLPKIPNFDRFRLWFIFGIGGAVALIVFLYFALFALPQATIAINTTASPISLNMNLSATGGAKKLDDASGVIPSSTQTYKQTAKKTITATGRQDIGSKATGTISITNCEDTNTHALPAGTVFAKAGLNYSSTDALTVPGGTFSGGGSSCTSSAVLVSVIANVAGTSYNQTAGNYTSGSLSGNYIITGSAMSGGSSKIVTVVSQQDVNNAAAAISNDTNQPDETAVTNQFMQQLDKAGYFLVASTLKVSKPIPSSSPAAGQQASSATVTVTINYTVLALKKSDLTKIITNYAEKQIDTTKQKIADGDILAKVKVEVVSQTSPTDATLSVSGSVNAMPIIDNENVKQMVAGKKRGEIQTTISGWPGVKSVEVKLSPFWVSKVPTKLNKITVIIQATTGDN